MRAVKFSRGLTADSPPFPGFLQFPIPFGENRFLPPLQFVFGSDVADGAVQPHRIVVIDVFFHHGARIVQRERRLRANAFAFDRLMPSLDLPVALRIVRRRPDVGHPANPDELLEIPRQKLRPVVRDDSRVNVGIFFPRPLKKDFDFGFLHGLANLPVNDVAAVPVQDTAQIVKRSADVDVRNVDMPMFMGLFGLMEAGSFLGRLPFPAL